jgi:hypothetical protein
VENNMAASANNRQRILNALACKNAPGDLPFLPFGLDALAAPPHPTYAPLFELLRERAVIKRRWVSRPEFFLPAAPVRIETQRITSEGIITDCTRLISPAGELHGERRDIPGTTASEATSRYLKSPEDVELYLSWPFAEPAVEAAPFFELERDVSTRGVVTHRIMSALGVVGENFEPEPLALLSIENTELALTLIETIAGRVYRHTRGLLEAGARPIFILGGPEFATPPLLSPRRFDDFVVQFDRPLIDMIHSYGCPVIVHCHGRVDAVLERFADMGVDGLHPLEQPPMGDVTLAQAKQRVGNHMCFFGTLQIGDMMSAAPQEVRRQVLAIRQEACPGMILTTSATPYESPMSQRLLENYIAAIEAASE